MQTGRNQPCPCGSGKKYKRCCLPRQEAEALEARKTELVPADEDADWLEDDDDFELAEEAAFDYESITRVVYSRGLVDGLANVRRGIGLEITEWRAPEIPPAVLEAIAGVDAVDLIGHWGDPASGDPIQVDLIDIESPDGPLMIESFNRAILPIATDDELFRRIHRLCEALGSAARGGAEPPRAEAAGTEAPDEPPAPRRPQHPAGSDGACALCGEPVTRRTVARHLAACAPAHDAAGGVEQALVQLKIAPPGIRAYWLYAEARADAKLEALDRFLRDIWLECCGHLSVFRAGDTEYFSAGYEIGGFAPPGWMGLRPRPIERPMRVRLSEALARASAPLQYEYDFGSTTMLAIQVAGERRGRIGRPVVRLLARNAPPEIDCVECGQPAALVCAFCGDDGGFVCEAHRASHACSEDDEAFLPVVNSPRMGVCAYAG